jgi:hypothetical protein
MSRKSKRHYNLWPSVQEYGESRSLTFYKQFSPYHMRLSDDFTVIDIWSSGHYWVGKTSYNEQTEQRITERGGSKGDFEFNPDDKTLLYEWLDGLFYAADMVEGES